MTTTAERCVCECEECLALRVAEDAPGSGETVASFEHDGSTYEIDHLGIGSGSQWGEFEVYCDGEEVAEFTLAESALRPGSRPAGLPVSTDELVRLARQALSGGSSRDDPPRGRPPGPLPARLRPLPPALRPAWPRSHRPLPRRPRPRSTPSARQPGNQHSQLQLIPGFGPVTRTGSGSVPSS
jgi:hypothetical protein